MKHLNIHVTGKVQGVWFRTSTKEAADKLGVNGFVRNEPDGGVYLEAEAETEALEALVAWLWEGPPKAAVTGVTCKEGEVEGFAGFGIRR